MKKAMQQLRQRVASALTNTSVPILILDHGYEVQLEMKGVQIGSIATLTAVLGWIDEIAAEGKDNEHGFTPD